VHNGGGMAFGRDGKLYVGVGDNQVATNAEDMTTVLGKILRLNPDGSIPTDNPFYGSTQGNNRAIYARGVRNPFTMDADPDSGQIFFNDVGPASFEEINEVKRGADYGWPSQGAGANRDSRFEDPVYAYLHSGNPGGCAITGGRFHRTDNPSFPSQYTNKYYFTDYCGGWIQSYDLRTGDVAMFASDLPVRPISPLIDEDGSIYYLSREERAVLKIEHQAENELQVTKQPEDAQVAAGGSVTFTVEAAGDGPFRYQWQKQSRGDSSFSDIAGARSSSLTINTVTRGDDRAEFRVVVRNDSDRVNSNRAELTVTDGSPPEPVITLPTGREKYEAGDTITYEGFATDPDESGRLPNEQLIWEVTFQHDDHDHPVLGPVSGRSGGSFVVPMIGETSANTWFRVHLTAIDSSGLETYIFRDIFPEKSRFTLQSNVDGLDLLLDGTPISAPTTTLGVVGVERTIGARPTQVVGNRTYEFVGWSDGGNISHTISTPPSNRTYTATYREIVAPVRPETPDPVVPPVTPELSGLVTQFRFDELAGTTTRDSASSGIPDTATLFNGARWTNDGLRNGAIQFDGVDDFLSIPDSVDFNDRDVDKFTVSLWFKADDVNQGSKQVLFKQQGRTRGLNIYLQSGQLYVGGWSDRADWQGTFLRTSNVRSNAWHQVTLVMDASSIEQVQSNGMRGYLDGVEFARGDAAAIRRHLGNVSLGFLEQPSRFHDGEARFAAHRGAPFAGVLDELRVFHRPLTAAEVARSYAAETQGVDVPPVVQPPVVQPPVVQPPVVQPPVVQPPVVSGGIQRNGTATTVFSEQQPVTLQLNAQTHVLTVGAERHEFAASSTDTFHLRAGAQSTTDQVRVIGTSLADQALVQDNRGEFRSSEYVVYTYDFETVEFEAGGGGDSARVFGSTSSDELQGLPQFTQMVTPLRTFELRGFERVESDGLGGGDLAQVYGTSGRDEFVMHETHELLSGPNYQQQTTGYLRVDAFGRDGYDTARLIGTSGNDHLYSFPSFAVMQSGPAKTVAKGFEWINTAVNQGGNDVAHFRNVSSSDRLVLSGNSAVLSGPDRFVVGSYYNTVEVITNVGQRPTVEQRSFNFELQGLSQGRGEPTETANRTELIFAQVGDADLDGVVGFKDFLILSHNFGDDDREYVWIDGDFTGDGSVGFDDFLLLAEQY